MQNTYGDNGLGTVDEVIQYSEVEPENTGGSEPSVQPDTQVTDQSVQPQDPGQNVAPTGDELPQDVNGLIQTVQSLREEINRRDEYTNFLKQYIDSGQISPGQAQAVAEEFDLEDDVVPFAGDVKKIVDAKVNKILNERLSQMQEEQVYSQMESIAAERKAKDGQFESKMDCAIELLRDPAYQAAYQKVPANAQARIAFLEKIAPMNPRYSFIPQAQANNEALDRIKANAALPPTLTGQSTAGSTGKAIKDLSDAEFENYFKSVVKNV